MPSRPSPSSNGALTLRGWAAEAEAAASIAKALAPTSFIPDHLKVWLNPDAPPSQRELDYDATVAQVAAVLLAGQELELSPMASLRAFVIIRGTVALYAIAARALLLHAGHDIVVVESTSIRAVVRGRRAGTDDWQTSVWDLDRAKVAQLYPGKPDGNWRKSPKAMLVARATAEASKWVAADAMLGLPPIVEEVEDAEVELVPVAAIEGPAPAPAPAEPAKGTARRRNAGKRAGLPSAAPGVPPPEPPPPAPPDERRRTGPRPSKAQLAKLHAMLGKLQITGPEEGLGLISVWAGHPVTSTKDLEPGELQVVFDRIESLLTIAAQDAAGEEDQAAAAPEDGDQAADVPPPEDEGQAPDEPGEPSEP
jgi:hypothetical protein